MCCSWASLCHNQASLTSMEAHMPRQWQLQEAKARFSQLVERALAGEVQVVTRRGRPAVVVIPYEEYERMQAGTTRTCPSCGIRPLCARWSWREHGLPVGYQRGVRGHQAAARRPCRGLARDPAERQCLPVGP